MSLLLIDLSMIYFKNGKPTILSVKMLRKSLVKNLNQVTRKILDHLHQQNPFKLVSNLNSIIKMLDKKGNEDEYQGAKIAVCGYVFLVKCSRDEAERSGRKLAATSKADLTIFEWGARSMNEGNGMSVELIERLNHELMGLEPPRKRRKGKKVKHEDDDDEDYE